MSSTKYAILQYQHEMLFFFNPFIVSPELSPVRDYVITHSVRSMCMYVCMYVYVCGILQN